MISKQIPFIPLVVAFIFQVSWVHAADPQKDFLQGTRYLRQKNFDNAIDSFNSAFKALFNITDRNEEQNKLLADILNNRGIAYIEKAGAGGSQNGYYDLAEKDFKNVQSLFPNNAKAGNNLGQLYYEQGRYEDAIYAYEDAVRLIPQSTPMEPYHLDLFVNLGISYAKMEPPNTDKALESFTQAIEIAKENPARDWAMPRIIAYYNRGNIYYNLNQYDEARTDYTETINFFEKAEGTKSKIFENAYYNRGLCYYHQGEYQEAINDYTKAIELNPG
jgi:tetratricopeptide (TPR) repeat protein